MGRFRAPVIQTPLRLPLIIQETQETTNFKKAHTYKERKDKVGDGNLSVPKNVGCSNGP